MNIINMIIDKIGNNLGKILLKSLSVFKLIGYYLNKREDRISKEKEINIKNDIQKKIDKTCDSGNLDDLFDLNKFIKITCIVIFLSFNYGCANTTINCQTTQSWEGHFYTEKDFYQATRDIKLQKNESIWVLSNKSLSRVIYDNKVK